MSVTQLISGGLRKDWLSIGYKVKLCLKISLVLNNLNLFLHFPLRPLFYVVCKNNSAFCLFLFYIEQNAASECNASQMAGFRI